MWQGWTKNLYPLMGGKLQFCFAGVVGGVSVGDGVRCLALSLSGWRRSLATCTGFYRVAALDYSSPRMRSMPRNFTGIFVAFDMSNTMCRGRVFIALV